ncbi:MAG: DNA ligase D [Silvibacterium sp.]|nr:DNA ligase D [Silvibacterium sp.]
MAPRRKAGTTTPPESAADAVDQQLARYRSMRDFSVTAEPSGKSRAKPVAEIPAGAQPFVIQKHAATRLHYDFRLGWNGVLKSWAVAKGPSYYVGDKRLAVQVEDHPMEYGGFEGIIPKGQYGGGTVMVWDQGWWEPQPGHTDVDAGLRDGSLKFILHGTKLHGKWALIRMKPRPKDRNPNWLLIKEHDEYERSATDPPITEEAQNSAVTGRSMDEIARAETHVWNSKDTATGKAWYRREKAPDSPSKPGAGLSGIRKSARKVLFGPSLNSVPKERLPAFIKPELATSADEPPSGPGWVHELKLDGYRMQARKDGEKVQLLTRSGLDWTHRMKALAAEVATLGVDSALIDGEVVVLKPDGTTSFASLQAAFEEGARHPLTYFAFDLLHLNGHNLRDLPLTERKAMLSRLFEQSDGAVRFSEHVDAPGDLVFKKACELQAEGIISKRADGKYISARTSDWRKIKCLNEQEFVVGGFTLPTNGIYGVGALLLGYYEKGKLIYAGRTGTGFTRKTHADLRARLDKLCRETMPFENPPAEARKGAIWVKPELVAQVHFTTWTADSVVRQAAFMGLREDKPAKEVRREGSSVSKDAEAMSERSDSDPPKRAAKKAAHAAPAVAAKSAPAKKTEPSDTGEHAPVRLTHPDKVLDAESGLTKQQLADYYWAIAPHMLPHIANRPISLVRCPEGTAHQCFYQKHVNDTLPANIESVGIRDKKSGKVEPYITLSTPETLAGLAQLGVLEIHPWGSCNDNLERPDRIIIDLDPDPAIPWSTLAGSAEDIREQLKSLGLESWLKTTGGKGLHVVAPIAPEHEWPIIKQFCHSFVLEMEKRNPRLYLTKMTKSARVGRIFLDYLRNERGATAVAAYSPRARPGAAVSMPLPWTALKEGALPIFRVTEFEQWKERLKRDPWKKLAEREQGISEEVLQALRVEAS